MSTSSNRGRFPTGNAAGLVLGVPTGYWIAAVVCAVALLLAGELTPRSAYGVFNPNTPDSGRLFAALGETVVWLSALAPIIAVRMLGLGIAAATVLPLFVLAAGDRHSWSVVNFVALLAVMVCASWLRPRACIAAGLVALAFPAALLVNGGTVLAPDGSQARLDGGAFGSASYRIESFVMWLVPVLIAVGIAMWARRSARQRISGRAALARAGQVEQEAAVVAERARLARDLHDVVAHHVSLIAVRAETAPYTHPGLDGPARTVLAEIAADARLALDELRGVLGILGRAREGEARAPQPTWGDIAALVDRTGGAGVDVRLAGDVVDADVSASTGYVAYRVVQEALTNARKHAAGSPVTVELSATAAIAFVRVRSGLGDGRSSAGGRGLAGMRERVEAIGGRLEAGPGADEFVVEATLPRAAA